MQCYFVIFVFLFAYSKVDGYHIRPIYVRQLPHYALGRDITQQEQLQQHEQQENENNLQQQNEQQQQQQASVVNMASMPAADDEIYEEAEVTPLYLESDDFSFLPDRMPDLPEDEYVHNEDQQTPFAYLKKSVEVPVMETENPLDLSAVPRTQPIFITMPIYINTPEQQRPVLVRMGVLPKSTTTAQSQAEVTETQRTEGEPMYEQEMAPIVEEPSPTSHYNRMLRNYYQSQRFGAARGFDYGRAFGAIPAFSPDPAFGPGPIYSSGPAFGHGRAITHGRLRHANRQRYYNRLNNPMHNGFFNQFYLKSK